MKLSDVVSRLDAAACLGPEQEPVVVRGGVCAHQIVLDHIEALKQMGVIVVVTPHPTGFPYWSAASALLFFFFASLWWSRRRTRRVDLVLPARGTGSPFAPRRRSSSMYGPRNSSEWAWSHERRSENGHPPKLRRSFSDPN